MKRSTQDRNVFDELSPEYLLGAYAGGFFPMADELSGSIRWYSPDPRGIVELEQVRISRSLRRTLRNNTYDITFDTAFPEVMQRCASRPSTWISAEIIAAYVRLYELGFAHSVESRRDGDLVGGLYGVALGGALFGESMFSIQKDASKAAFAALCETLRARGFLLLDTQFITPHLTTLGASEIPRDEYLRRLKSALSKKCIFP